MNKITPIIKRIEDFVTPNRLRVGFGNGIEIEVSTPDFSIFELVEVCQLIKKELLPNDKNKSTPPYAK